MRFNPLPGSGPDLILAPAKLNLYLHITGRRTDGYHLIDSLFVFTTLHDVLTITPSNTLSLTIDGDFYSALSNESIEKNIVYRAANKLREKYHVMSGAKIHLKKQIPVGAGLGGGSSDAAAILTGLNHFWNLHCDEERLSQIGLALGADVPACITQKPAIVSGIGEKIMPISLPYSRMPVLLINSNQPLSTQAVYTQFHKNNRSFTNETQNAITPKSFIKNLQNKHNDLQFPAIQLQPEITVLLDHLAEQKGCLVSRMSGSGPTCFALFSDMNLAVQAQRTLSALFSNYWVCLSEIA